MSAIFQASIFGFNLLPTLFLGLLLLYWITVIAGFLDHSMFDLNLDTDIDVDVDVDVDVDTGVELDGATDGVFHSILVFFNLGEIPLMLFLSFVFLIMWVSSVILKLMIDTNVFMSGVLLIPEFISALFLTKILPRVGFSNPATRFKSVDFPEPDVPKRQQISPFWISRLIPFRA